MDEVPTPSRYNQSAIRREPRKLLLKCDANGLTSAALLRCPVWWHLVRGQRYAARNDDEVIRYRTRLLAELSEHFFDIDPFATYRPHPGTRSALC